MFNVSCKACWYACHGLTGITLGLSAVFRRCAEKVQRAEVYCTDHNVSLAVNSVAEIKNAVQIHKLQIKFCQRMSEQ